MGSIILAAVEILTAGAGVYFVPFFTLFFMSAFFLLYLYFGFKIRKPVYYIVLIIFLLRVLLSVDFEDFNREGMIEIKSNIVNGRGRVEKIENKFPLENIYISVENIPDGKYIFYGFGEKISDKYNFYDFKVKDKKEIPLNRFEVFFEKRFQTLEKYLSNRCSNFLKGVVLGERRYIYDNIREKFTYCGTAHLLAISGLHIGVVTGIILFILNIFKMKREIKYALALIFLTFYMLGITDSPSAFRAYIMGAVFLTGKIFYEKSDIRKSLALAVIINLIINPVSLGNLSFIFSYLCLFSIVYIYPEWRIVKEIKYKNILNFLIFTGIIQIFITPVSVYFFGTIPFLSYFTNFILTPVGMIFVTLGFISFFIPKIFILAVSPLLQGIYNMIEVLLNFFSKIPYLIIEYNGDLTLKFIIFTYIILAVLFLKKKLYRKK